MTALTNLWPFRLFVRPDFVIGGAERPYMRRWWLIPRNRWFNIYLHEIRHSDDDRALHDHPWWNVSVLLKGSYEEVLPGGLSKIRKGGSITIRRPEQLHRLVIVPGEQTWSLFITGPVLRDWGFACPKGWRIWTDYVSTSNKHETGPGCD